MTVPVCLGRGLRHLSSAMYVTHTNIAANDECRPDSEPSGARHAHAPTRMDAMLAGHVKGFLAECRSRPVCLGRAQLHLICPICATNRLQSPLTRMAFLHGLARWCSYLSCREWPTYPHGHMKTYHMAYAYPHGQLRTMNIPT